MARERVHQVTQRHSQHQRRRICSQCSFQGHLGHLVMCPLAALLQMCSAQILTVAKSHCSTHGVGCSDWADGHCWWDGVWCLKSF
ncbi:hypothetical protein JZ751_014776 [Albula glossodonta]|uniref:Uncharacterized protein n=1 Tax=Albula glossodonta TaxID=121402 RepID=A0A8T2N4C1_9TELE|nr:hypothetical protein JZ751_014776 [Albula glossodonta]